MSLDPEYEHRAGSVRHSWPRQCESIQQGMRSEDTPGAVRARPSAQADAQLLHALDGRDSAARMGLSVL